MRMKSVLVAAMTIVVGLMAAAAAAQEVSIVGTVSDQTKAVLPGATVTATNVATGAQSTAVSDARGEYRILSLPPGQYRVQAELQGFATVVVPSIELLVGQNATVPFVLGVAQVSETVTEIGRASCRERV